MADIIQQRRDTAARWAQYNPILLEGEVGYVTDNPNQYKIGNGVSRWNDLPLRGYNGTITQEKGNDENAVMSQAAVTKELSELGSEVGKSFKEGIVYGYGNEVDLNQLPMNTCFTFNNVSIYHNAPSDFKGNGIVTTFGVGASGDIAMQTMRILGSDSLYVRLLWGSWNKWIKYLDDSYVQNVLDKTMTANGIVSGGDAFDMNSISKNTIYTFQNATNVSNAPSNLESVSGILVTYIGNVNNPEIGEQLLYCMNGCIYHRNKWGAWSSSWVNIAIKDAVIAKGQKTLTGGIDNLNDAEINVIYTFQNTANVANIPEGVNELNGTLITIAATKNSDIASQIYFDIKGYVYYRLLWGTWGKWTSNKKDHTAVNDGGKLLYVLDNLAVIGDSLSSGEIVVNGKAKDIYSCSWLSCLGKKIGAKRIEHYSAGGQTAKGWLTSNSGLSKMKNDEAQEVYFIALGTNDRYYYDQGYGNSYPLGDVNDAKGTDSFAGYYKQIIEEINIKNPNAIIFCVSMYTNKYYDKPYSDMVKKIADLYNNAFYIDYANADVYHLYDDEILTVGGHYTALGYSLVANAIANLLEKTLEGNKANSFVASYGYYRE